MNIVEFMIYNNFSQFTIPEDNEILQERLLKYSKLFKYNIGIITEQDLSALKFAQENNITFLKAKSFLEKIISILLKQFYTSEEQLIILGFYLSYSFPSLILEKEMINFLEELIKFSSEKEELVYCLEEIKYRLLNYYVLYSSDQQKIDELFTELGLIEDRHNSMDIFAMKENGNN